VLEGTCYVGKGMLLCSLTRGGFDRIWAQLNQPSYKYMCPYLLDLPIISVRSFRDHATSALCFVHMYFKLVSRKRRADAPESQAEPWTRVFLFVFFLFYGGRRMEIIC
jgi:hypothetical protein